MVRRPLAILLLSALTLGCGDSTATSPDAAADAPTDASTPTYGPSEIVVAGPEPVAPWSVTCAEGWTLSEVHGVAVCRPFDATGPKDCPRGQAHFPGRPGCEPIGPACPAGDFADDLPSDRVVWYVRPGAVGNGTEADPFGTIAQAMRVAAAGQTVALAKGTYRETVQLSPGVALIGACVEETHVTGTPPPGALGVIRLSTGEGRIERLRVSGPADAIATQAPLVLRSVEIEAPVGSGVYSWAAPVTGERVVIRGVRALPNQENLGGFGFEAQGGATVDLRWVSVEGTERHPVAAAMGSEIRLEDALLRNSSTGSPFAEGATLVFRRVAIFDAYVNGVIGLRGSTIEATDTWIEATRPRDDGIGAGLAVDGSTATLERVTLLTNPHSGLQATGEAGRVEGRQVAILDTRTSSELGVGMLATNGATIELAQTRIVEAEGAGVVLQSRSRGIFTDLHVARVSAGGTLGIGLGVNASEGSDLQLTRAKVVDAVDGLGIRASTAVVTDLEVSEMEASGVLASEAASLTAHRMLLDRSGETATMINGATVSWRDVHIRDAGGRGVQLSEGTQADFENMIIERVTSIGLALYRDGTRLDLRQLEIRDMRSEPDSGLSGYGLFVAEEATVEGRQLAILRARGFGALSINDAEVRLEDIRITDTARLDCVADCAPLGVGASAVGDARLELENFSIEGSGLCGAQMAHGGQLSIRRGAVASNPIGLNVQSGVDPSTVHSEVEFRNNDRLVDATLLPLPMNLPLALD
ncbi:MAG: DUF1565 domain-containing protein [Myxococcota bacterium]